MTWRILSHALWDLQDHGLTLLKSCWVWMVLLVIANGLYVSLPFFPNVDWIFIVYAIVIAICIVVGFLSPVVVAIAWHRLVLLGESGGSGFRVDARWPVFRYAVRAFVLMLLCLAAIFSVSLVLLLMSAFLQLGPKINLFDHSLSIFAFFVPMLLCFNYVWQRCALALPAIAIGDRQTRLSESWSLTRPMALPLLGLVPFLAVPYVFGLLFTSILAADVPIGVVSAVWVLQLAMYLFALLLNISVLTTLYGHLVHKWPL